MSPHRSPEDIGELLANSADDEEEAEPTLPFDWAELPRRHVDAVGLQSLRAHAAWSTRLASGREIRMTHLTQCSTLGGVLCGSPRQPWFNDWIVQNAIRHTANEHSIKPAQVVVLAPLMTATGVRPSRDQESDGDIEIIHLPPVRSVATFWSGALRDSAESFSTALVLWFQDTYGPPTPGHVEDQLQRIDWEAVAQEGEY